MPTETDFEPRYSPSVLLQTPCQKCKCPPSQTRWLGLKCPGTLIGTVRDARTQEPLQNISVWVESFETDSFGEATTNGLGHFRINDLEAGEGYILTASGPGYSYRVLEDGVLPEEGLMQDVELVRSGAVKGTILNSNGEPVQGATLYFTQEDEPSLGTAEAETDADGEFCVCELDASSASSLNGSTYNILAVHSDYSFLEITRFVAPRYVKTDEVEWNDTLPERATIQGVVTSDGVPLEGAVVGLSDDSNGLLPDHSDTLTDGAGSFSLRVNAPATYGLFAQGDQTSVAEATISVTPGVPVFQNLEVSPPGSLSGVVLHSAGEPVEGALVELLAQAGDAGTLVDPEISDADGSYNFLTVPPTATGATYVLRASLMDGDSYSLFAERDDVAVASNVNNIADLRSDS